MAKGWDFFSIWDKKGSQSGYCLHLMQMQERKWSKSPCGISIREAQAQWGTNAWALCDHHILPSPGCIFCLELGVEVHVSNTRVHVSKPQKGNEERSCSISEQNNIRSWGKTHYTLLEAGSFLFMGKQSISRALGQLVCWLKTSPVL